MSILRTFCCLSLLITSAFSCLSAEDRIRDLLQEEQASWYDQAADSWKRIEIQSPKEAPDVPAGMNVLGEVFIFLMYAVIIGLVAYLLYLFISHMSQRKAPTVNKPLQQAQIKSSDLQSLPFEHKADANDPHQILQDAHQQGNWPKVIIYCLIVLLIEFHRARLLDIRRGKTNGHYLRELQKQAPNKSTLLKHCIHLFEKSYFGHQTIQAQQAQELFNHVQKMSRLLQQEAGTQSGAHAHD